jgi:hypothetical protein
MSGKRAPGSTGGNAEIEDIDAGTSARISTPAPAHVAASGPVGSTSTQPPTSDVPMSGGVLYAAGHKRTVHRAEPKGEIAHFSPRARAPASWPSVVRRSPSRHRRPPNRSSSRHARRGPVRSVARPCASSNG